MTGATDWPGSPGQTNRGDIAGIWRHYRGYHRSILAAAAAATIAVIAELGTLAIVVTLTSLIGNQQATWVMTFSGRTISVSTSQLLILAALLILVRALFRQLDTQISASLGCRYEDRKRSELTDSFLKASWPMQSQQRSSELQDVISGAVGIGRQGLKAMATAAGSLVSIVVMLFGALAMSWITTLIAIAVSFLLSICIQPMVRSSKKIAAQVQNASIEYAGSLGETVALAREIRLAGVESHFQTRLQAVSSRLERLRVREQVLGTGAPNIFETGTLLLVLAGLAGLYLMEMENTTRFIALLLLLLRSSQYGRNLQTVYHQMKTSGPYLQMIDRRDLALRSSAPVAGTQSIDRFESLEFRGVGYEYDSSNSALDDVSLTIAKGEVIGIIGPSGSGKSTLIELLLGLRVPTSGTIVVDGVELQDLRADDWSGITGLVSQESQLVEGDLADNVRFFRESVSESDIEAAVAASGLDRDLHSLPNGLGTRIGPRSSGLSGGQRQRLSIARVLAGHPQLLVLDEPTSSLDVHAEAVITDTLQRLKGSTTIVVVAHRLSTLRVCDKVLVLRDGHVDAFASRPELEQDNAYYSSAIDLAQLS